MRIVLPLFCSFSYRRFQCSKSNDVRNVKNFSDSHQNSLKKSPEWVKYWNENLLKQEKLNKGIFLILVKNDREDQNKTKLK